jgi:NADPH:quinone reductase-like Zn-dependent oxidoreductase
MRAAGVYGAFSPPCIVGGEGVGRLEDGRRVYFGHSLNRYGSWAELTLVPEAEAWPLPDDVDDGGAIALGISGTGALIPLEEAKVRPGDRVLVLGATGPVGQIALQLARHMGVGTGMRPAAERRAAFERLLALSRDGRIEVDVMSFALDDALAAWEAQRHSPHGKIIVIPARQPHH